MNIYLSTSNVYLCLSLISTSVCSLYLNLSIPYLYLSTPRVYICTPLVSIFFYPVHVCIHVFIYSRHNYVDVTLSMALIICSFNYVCLSFPLASSLSSVSHSFLRCFCLSLCLSYGFDA